MELHELSTAETVALVSLAEHLVHEDGVLSTQELEDLVDLGKALGNHKFEEAVAASRKTWRQHGDVVELAEIVRNPASRLLIYATLEQVAAGDGVSPEEADLLAELRQAWELGPPSPPL